MKVKAQILVKNLEMKFDRSTSDAFLDCLVLNYLILNG